MKRYQDLTDLIPELEASNNYGDWVKCGERRQDEQGNWLPYVAPYVSYSPAVTHLIDVVSHYHSGVHRDSMKETALEYTEANLTRPDVESLPVDVLIFYIRKVVKNERYRDGIVLEYLENGYLLKWLKRLRELDV